MSRVCIYYTRASLRFPRVSGDEPPLITSADQLDWFSPRERG